MLLSVLIVIAKNSIFSFHWHNHHKVSRMYKMIDFDYDKPLWHKSRYKEPLILSLLAVSHVWFVLISPLAFLTLVAYVFVYYHVHKFCHTEIGNARRYFPHHWLHHTKGKQDFNWCVVFPLADIIMGTYKRKADFL
jgi:hypothetical protein